jgi:chemotaxis protein MotB
MFRRRKKNQTQANGTPGWMLTFGDMNTLLLTFLIMLIASMSKVTAKSDMSLILSTLSGSIGMLTGGNTLTKGSLVEGGNTVEALPSRDVGTRLARSVQDLSQELKPELKSQNVRIDETQKGFLITLASDLFFRPASADISYEEGKDTLRKLGIMMKSLPPNIKIEVIAHTDNTTIPKESAMSRLYPSNWELSSARASAIVRYLAGFGVTMKMTAEGRGDQDPVEKNDTEEGKAFNRRIDIVVSQGD